MENVLFFTLVFADDFWLCLSEILLKANNLSFIVSPNSV